MKFNLTRLFDISQLLSTKAGQQLKDFIETVNQLQDNILRLAQNNITLEDNLNCEFKKIVVRSSITEYVVTCKSKPTLVLLNTHDGAIDNVVAFNWKYDARGSKIKCYIKPATATSVPLNVEILIFYK